MLVLVLVLVLAERVRLYHEGGSVTMRCLIWLGG